MNGRLWSLIALWASLSAVSCASCKELEWMNDFEAAKKKAADEEKGLFVFFTGSDWCGWCVRLKAEILDQETFQSRMSRSFVFVEIDSPRQKALPPETTAQNRKLISTFGVNSFPTVMLMTANGKAYGRTGYRRGGLDEYIKYIEAIQSRKAELELLFPRVEKAEGVDKARLLDQVAAKLRANGLEGPANEYIPQIKELDPDNRAGLKAKYDRLERFYKVIADARTPGKGEAVNKALDELLAERPETSLEQLVYMMKGRMALADGNSKDAIAHLKAAIQADPWSEEAPGLKEQLKELEGLPAGPKR